MSDQKLPDEITAHSPQQPGNGSGPATAATAAPSPAEAAEAADLIGALEAELAEARAQAAENLEGWQRAQAEFANYKRRVERERADIYQNAADAVILRFLAVLDDLERALASRDRPQAPEEAARWAQGIELIFRKLQTVLEAQGISRMQAEGEHFDPRLHEAVTHEESDEYEDGQIIQILQPGYVRGEKVVRPAMVRVARK